MRCRLILACIGLCFAAPVLAQDVCAPAKPSISVGAGKTTIVVSWVEVGDDCNTDNATSYEVRRSSSPITDTNWQSTTTIVASGSTIDQGLTECIPFDGLPCNTTYYWVVFVFDDAGNRSPMSNAVQRGTNGCSSHTEITC